MYTKAGAQQAAMASKKIRFIFPVTPIAPARQQQGVSGANPQPADCQWYQSRRSTFSLWSHKLEKSLFKKKVVLSFIFYTYILSSTLPSSFNTYSIWCSRVKKLWGDDQVGGGSMITFIFWSIFSHLTIRGLSGLTVEENQTSSGHLQIPYKLYISVLSVNVMFYHS